jgi:hypothetical protein
MLQEAVEVNGSVATTDDKITEDAHQAKKA